MRRPRGGASRCVSRGTDRFATAHLSAAAAFVEAAQVVGQSKEDNGGYDDVREGGKPRG